MTSNFTSVLYTKATLVKSKASLVLKKKTYRKKPGSGFSKVQDYCLSVCLSLSRPSFNFDPQIYRRSFQQRMDAESVSGRLM